MVVLFGRCHRLELKLRGRVDEAKETFADPVTEKILEVERQHLVFPQPVSDMVESEITLGGPVKDLGVRQMLFHLGVDFSQRVAVAPTPPQAIPGLVKRTTEFRGDRRSIGLDVVEGPVERVRVRFAGHVSRQFFQERHRHDRFRVADSSGDFCLLPDPAIERVFGFGVVEIVEQRELRSGISQWVHRPEEDDELVFWVESQDPVHPLDHLPAVTDAAQVVDLVADVDERPVEDGDVPFIRCGVVGSPSPRPVMILPALRVGLGCGR